MTGPQLALLVTILLTAGAVWAISHLVTIFVDWQDRRRQAPRFEPRRIALVAEDDTDDEPTADLTPYVCPYCHRNAGHDADCYGLRVQRRVDEIRIPRDGEITP